jgi:feruloyl esterase
MSVSDNDGLYANLEPDVMMKKEKYYPPACELDALQKAAIEACDELDGVKVGHD